MCSYGLIKFEILEAELDTPDRYGASVAIGEQVLLPCGMAKLWLQAYACCWPSHVQCYSSPVCSCGDQEAGQMPCLVPILCWQGAALARLQTFASAVSDVDTKPVWGASRNLVLQRGEATVARISVSRAGAKKKAKRELVG